MINGLDTDLISVRDRGLQYGDGCFETLRISKRVPVLLEQHMARLEKTCQRLRLEYDRDALRNELTAFLQACQPDGVIKILITRGIGGRGYTAPGSSACSRILMYSPLPAHYARKTEEGISIGISPIRLSENSYTAGLKHLNRLDQVLASFALDDTIDEALCLDQAGNVIEGTKSNLVLVLAGQLLTPVLDGAGVRGIMLDYLIDQFTEKGTRIQSRKLSLADVRVASELFLCNSVFGIWPVRKLTENANLRTWSTGPWTQQALRFYHDIPETAR